MSTDQILLGIALTITLAVAAQVLAAQLRIPALILLLVFGFAAGAATDVVHPDKLLGAAFEPLVSVAVGLILYDAGLGLDLRRLTGHARRVVIRLIVIGVPVTFFAAAGVANAVLDVSTGAAFMLGAIVVVSGPTVVGPLLAFVQPAERTQKVLAWEGSLIDPIGAILGAVIFAGVEAGTRVGTGRQVPEFLLDLGLGLVGGVVGLALLWFLLRRLDLGEVLGSAAQVAVVVAIVAVCDVVRDDTGLIAAIVMGLAVGNIRGFAISQRRPFSEVLVQLTLGLLFISISATVTPSSLPPLILPTVALVAALVLVVRPIVAAVSTWRTELSGGERGLIGWMAPRGIVAAATASTFGADLATKGVKGASDILPVTFMVIVATVTLYGLTAVPVARALHAVRPARSRPLLVGGEPWAIDIGRGLREAGLDVLAWAGRPEERDRVRAAGFELAPGDAVASAAGQGVRIEGVTMVLLLTDEDDFNALATSMLTDTVDGGVFRIGPPSSEHGVIAPYTGDGLLFGPELSAAAVRERYRAGARILVRPAATGIPPAHDLLFVVGPEGQLLPVTTGGVPDPGPDDTVVLLST